jgi:transposase, IS5 family
LIQRPLDTSANVNDINVARALLHGHEETAFGDAGYQGVHLRAEAQQP